MFLVTYINVFSLLTGFVSDDTMSFKFIFFIPSHTHTDISCDTRKIVIKIFVLLKKFMGIEN